MFRTSELVADLRSDSAFIHYLLTNMFTIIGISL